LPTDLWAIQPTGREVTDFKKPVSVRINGNPICVRGLAREKLVYPQGCGLSQDESSLSFTMLLRLESLFPFSPPLAGGNLAILGDDLLDSDSCQSSRLLGFWILETW
jgi:hypothetical protein